MGVADSWRPIDDGLEENEVVLLYSEVDIDGGVVSIYTVGYIDEGDVVTMEEKILRGENLRTTHWMSLPLPPR